MNIQDALKVLSAAAMANDTVLMEGVHGIGKSDIVKQFSEQNDYHVETLFLSHQEVGDLIGMPRTIEHVVGKKMVVKKDSQGQPMLSEETGEPIQIEVDDIIYLTAWTKPIWLQRMEKAAEAGKRTVLFLDELNRAPIDVRQTALQLVLERQIHEHDLPVTNGFKSLIVAAINPADEYQVDELDMALLDRFLTLEIEVDADAWLDWSLKNKVNHIVRSFIIDNPTKLHYQPEPDAGGGATVGATPRSWTMLGKFIDNVDKIAPEILFQVVKGKIGPHLAGQFISYLNNYKDIVKVEDVEKLVGAMMKKTTNVEKLGDGVAKLLMKVEAIQKGDLVQQMTNKYLKGTKEYTAQESLPYMALLYAVEVEILNRFLKTFKAEDRPTYSKLAVIDDQLNNKKLFLKVVDKF